MTSVVSKRRPAAATRQAPSRPPEGRPAAPAGDRWLAYSVVPLRFFLGVTFIFAGLQKIADPGFLNPGAPTYIGAQLHAFALRSPVGFAVNTFALPTPQLTGIAVIVTELVVGILVVAGIATRWAAAAGALVNFVFFLTASWTVQPYFLGSDSIYTVAWITLVLAGDQGLLAARPLLFGASPATPATAADLDRRRLILQLGGAAVAVVWALAIVPRSRAAVVGETPSPSPSPTPAPSPSAAPGGTPHPSPTATPAGTRIGTRADLASQGFLDFSDPKTGEPAIAVGLSGNRVVAFNAICTHAGCEVQYDPSSRLLACPCHGALFDPSHNAAVVGGPAPTPLPAIPVQVASDGAIYAT
jgi:thiosulfate dehydrogenase (quinone) large subunit